MRDEAPKRSGTRTWLRFLPILLIAGLFVVFIASGEWRWLSLSDLAAHRDALMRLVERHPLASLGAFLALYVLVIIACVPGPSVMTIAGGFLFGPLLGGAAALTAALVGSTAVFLACRTAFGDWAARRAGRTAARIEAGFSRDAFAYLLALRLMPVAPFFMVNLTAGLARIRLSTFLVATAIGAAPSSFIFAGLGSGLGRLFQLHERADAHLLARPEIAVPLTGLAVLSLSPVVWRLWRARSASRS